MLLSRLGPLIIPILVIGYSGYMIAEQYLGSYRESSQNYALLLGGVAILCALIVLARLAMGADEGEADDLPHEPAPRWHYVQLIAIVAMMALAVLLIPVIGYAITFFVMLVAALLLLGVRSVPAILAISVGMVAVVHFGLVKELQLPLPAGILEGIL
ncbi:tripartite tricarboxylate transporter TctB family protein [Bosea sp. 117]|uniref:tripartite tricarboxylate transporter TctB family protein n=1 Tax=Bosea sp. 117 TaxID=1125973 RepID=UPI0009DEAE7C|nr:tripartite tricarboxylate transporter TctB family protein [Bosea sp. 117]